MTCLVDKILWGLDTMDVREVEYGKYKFGYHVKKFEYNEWKLDTMDIKMNTVNGMLNTIDRRLITMEQLAVIVSKTTFPMLSTSILMDLNILFIIFSP